MRHALIIARRELRQRSFVFMAAAVVAVVPFLLAMLPVGRSMGPATMVAGVATFLVPLLTIGLAVMLGSSIVGRELAERRLSFYFARPISTTSIWFGKVIAALVLILATFGITLLPSLAFAQHSWNAGVMVSLPQMVILTLRAALVLFFIAHFASVMTRSRSALALVDLLLAVIALVAAALIVRPLFIHAPLAFKWTTGYLEVSLCVAILIAGAWQLARGRIDPRASHHEMSRAMWLLLASFMIVAAGYAWWVLSPGPSALKNALAFQAPGGEWMLARGDAPIRGGVNPAFLMKRGSDQWIRFSEATNPRGAFFTRDGSAAFALQPLAGGPPRGGELIIQRLNGDRARIVTGIMVPERSHFTVSDDLERVALLTDGRFSIHDVRNGSLLATVRLPLDPQSPAPLMFFPDRYTVRLYLHQSSAAPHKVQVYEVDIPRKRLTLKGELSMFAKWVRLLANSDGSLAIATPVHAASDAKVRIVDGRTAELRRTLDTTNPASYWFLADGRIAGLENAGPNAVLRIYNGDGTLQREIAIGNAASVAVIEIGHPDQLVVGISRNHPLRVPSDWAVVDTKRGVIEREERGIGYFGAYNLLDPRKPEPNRSSELVITDKEGRVWQWNVLTGEKTRLFAS